MLPEKIGEIDSPLRLSVVERELADGESRGSYAGHLRIEVRQVRSVVPGNGVLAPRIVSECVNMKKDRTGSAIVYVGTFAGNLEEGARQLVGVMPAHAELDVSGVVEPGRIGRAA